MPAFKATIQKFSRKGEKTGWTYIDIPVDVLDKLKLKDKKGFRIKGVIDNVAFNKLSTYPIGGGSFIIAINAELLKKIGKQEGATISIKLELDQSKPLQSKELIAALKDDKIAYDTFSNLNLSHKNYFHRYIESAKTVQTKAERIVNVINAMYLKQNYGEMIRSLKR